MIDFLELFFEGAKGWDLVLCTAAVFIAGAATALVAVTCVNLFTSWEDGE